MIVTQRIEGEVLEILPKRETRKGTPCRMFLLLLDVTTQQTLVFHVYGRLCDGIPSVGTRVLVHYQPRSVQKNWGFATTLTAVKIDE